MAGPELALAPPAVNGRAILLMAVLEAKEYFGCTEAGASESYGEGWDRETVQHNMQLTFLTQ